MFAIKRRLSATNLNKDDAESFLAVDQYKGNTNIMKELLEAGQELQKAEQERNAAHRRFLDVVSKLKLWLELVRDDRHRRELLKHEQQQTVNLGPAAETPVPDSKHVDLAAQFIQEENNYLGGQEEMLGKFSKLLLEAIPQVLDHEVKLVPLLIDKYHSRHAEYEVAKGHAAANPGVEKYEQEAKTALDKFDQAKSQLLAACEIVHGREREVVDRLSAYLYVQSEYVTPAMFGGALPSVTAPPPGLFGPVPVKLSDSLQRLQEEAKGDEASSS